MMFTCSALRCSVFDGSAISGTSDDPVADDPLAAQCIPDSVLYVTVDDHAGVDVFRDLEHPMHLPFDASGDVRPPWRREFNLCQIIRWHGLQEIRLRSTLRVRVEEAVDIRGEDGSVRTEGTGEFEHEQVAGTDGESAPHVPHDVAKGHRREAERGELQERRQVHRRDAAIVQGQYDGRGDGDRGESRTIQGVHDKTVELSHVGLHAGRGCSFRRGGASVLQTVPTGEDVSEGTRAVDDQQRLAYGGKLRRETPDRGAPGRPQTRLLREDAPAELHEEHGDSGDASRHT